MRIESTVDRNGDDIQQFEILPHWKSEEDDVLVRGAHLSISAKKHDAHILNDNVVGTYDP